MKTLDEFIGTILTEDEIEQLQEQGVRVKRPGFMYTMEFIGSRVNVHLDEQNMVLGINQG
jgi:hypothetical protein